MTILLAFGTSFLLLLSATCHAQSQLEITEYACPPYIYEGNPEGVGSMYFEQFFGDSLRATLGVDYKFLKQDSLTQFLYASPEDRARSIKSSANDTGAVWYMEYEWDRRTWCHLFTVKQDSSVVYRFRNCDPVEGPGARQRSGHWWVECNTFRSPEDTAKSAAGSRGSQVIVDGQLLSESRGYSNTLFYNYVGNKPFFVFRRDSIYGWSYDGIETETDWNGVFDPARTQGEEAASAPRFFANAFQFYALRKGEWYMVIGRVRQAEAK